MADPDLGKGPDWDRLDHRCSLSPASPESQLNRSEFPRQRLKSGSMTDMSVIFCDAGQNRVTEDETWGCVVDAEGRDLIAQHPDLVADFLIREKSLPVGRRQVLVGKFSDVKTAQNNGGELMALVAALRIALRVRSVKVVNCDSQLLVQYWSRGHVNPKTAKRMDPAKLTLIRECTRLRAEFEKAGGAVQKLAATTTSPTWASGIIPCIGLRPAV